MSYFNLSLEQLNNHIRSQEIKVQPYLTKINELKEEIENYISAKEYNKAIECSDKIIELSKEIEDIGLEKDQENLKKRITELDHRIKIDVLSHIDEIRVIVGNHLRLHEIHEAIESARRIIELAKEADLQEVIKEYEALIAQLLDKHDLKYTWSEIKAASDSIRKKYDALIKRKNIVEAHKEVVNFSEEYGKNCNLMKIPSAEYVISKDEILWNKYIDKKNKLKKELTQLEKQYNNSIEDNNIKEARNAVEKAWIILNNLKDEKLVDKWAKIEDNLVKEEENLEELFISELRKEIELIIEESKTLAEKNQFDEAITKLEFFLVKIKNQDFPEYKKELEDEINSIIMMKEDYDKLISQINELDKELRIYLENKNLNESLNLCEKILEISALINSNDMKNKYSLILEEIRGEIADKEVLEQEKESKLRLLKQFKNNIKELNKEGLSSLNKGAITDCYEIYSKIITLFENFKEDNDS
ncbi:MAG: hypothetical protein ACFFAO_15875 [Candidatus Hermodarchaeota archaeon]